MNVDWSKVQEDRVRQIVREEIQRAMEVLENQARESAGSGFTRNETPVDNLGDVYSAMANAVFLAFLVNPDQEEPDPFPVGSRVVVEASVPGLPDSTGFIVSYRGPLKDAWNVKLDRTGNTVTYGRDRIRLSDQPADQPARRPASGHSTMSDTRPHPDSPGGRWEVVCTCGWTKTGGYARSNEIAEAVALNLANAYGIAHEQDPKS